MLQGDWSSDVCSSDLDLSQEADRARVIGAGRGAHYLVNAAGILFVKPIWDVTLEDWQRIWAVNVDSMFFLCQEIGRASCREREGVEWGGWRRRATVGG